MGDILRKAETLRRAAARGKPHIARDAMGWWHCQIPGRSNHGIGHDPSDAYRRWALANPDAPLSARMAAAEAWPT